MTPEELYLDLLKKTLAFTLWPEPPMRIDAFNYLRPRWKRKLVSLVSNVLASKNIALVKEFRPFTGGHPVTQEQRESGMIFPLYAETMIGLKRLSNIQYCVETVLRDGVEGDLIETGVWRGGACIFMRAILAAYADENRKVYVADSFEGLPKPNAGENPADAGDKHYTQRFFAISKEEVENNFKRYGLLDDKVVFLKGWFRDTLPSAPVKRLAVLRLDGDMYGSTMDALRYLYSKLSKGGFCIVDDYALPACKLAVDEFRAENKIVSEVMAVDWTGVYWRKD